MNPLIHHKKTTLPLLITIVLACFGLSPSVQAVSPAPDGGYPGDTTAEGDNALFSLTNGNRNTAVGGQALFSDTEGYSNTAVGAFALQSNTTGFDNTAVGDAVLQSNTTGAGNTAIGGRFDVGALNANTTGYANTAIGVSVLVHSTTGTKNTAAGLDALFWLDGGDGNIALGCDAALNLNTGSNNIDIGTDTGNESNTIRIGNVFATTYFDGTPHPPQTNTYIAGIDGVTVAQGRAVFVGTNGHLGTTNTTGFDNTALGDGALLSNTTGDENTALGVAALQFNTTGNANTATGVQALQNNTAGNSNTADGLGALFHNATGNNNTASGVGSLNSNTTGIGNIALGTNAGFNLTTGNNNIDIGNLGVAAEANTIRVGTEGTQTATFIAGISGTTVAKSVAVFVDATGHLGTKGSSERFKDQIKPMGEASNGILALKPVSFRYKKEIDPERALQFGLVAEDVAKVNPDLVARDAKGELYTVRYDAVNAMLLNEFLKEHRKVEEQGVLIARQQKQIDALTAGLQKVSAQLEVSKPAPKTVLNNQ